MKKKRIYHKNQSLRRDYYNYYDICTVEGIEKSRAKNVIGTIGVEGIKHLDELRPIEHLFEVFERPRKGGIVNQYGIRRRFYDEWKETGEVPKVSTGRPPKWKDNPNVSQVRFYLDKDVYKEFKAIVDKANSMSVIKVTYREMLAVAVQEFNDRRRQILDGQLPSD